VRSHLRLLALGGVVGPLAFVGAWVVSGAITTGYSPIDDAISDLAAVGASTRVLMTVGFVAFGCGLVGFGLALREVLQGRAWVAAVVTGAATIGVAGTPLGGWSGDALHAVFAGVGYVAIFAIPVLAAPSLRRIGRIRWARASRLTAGVSAVCLVASTLGPAHGLWQRFGLTMADAWIAFTALGVLARTRLRKT
jgi:hypothetical membrane protein